MAAHFERKLIDCHALATLRATLPAPVIFTNGVFDILHRGHISYLDAARALGTCLIVGINSDASVRTLNRARRASNARSTMKQTGWRWLPRLKASIGSCALANPIQWH